MGLAILGVVFVLYIVLAYLASRTWPAWHVVLTVFLFIGAFCFCFLASATFKVQQKWRTSYNQSVAQIESEEANQERLLRGTVDGEPGNLQLLGQAKRMIVDRGRVWRNLRLADVTDGQVVLDASRWNTGCYELTGSSDVGDEEFVVEEFVDEEEEVDAAEVDPAEVDVADAPAAAQPQALGLETDSVVYAFQETPLRALPPEMRNILLDESDLAERDVSGQCRVPTHYMGEYRVSSDPAANPKAITLTPTIPLRQDQIDQFDDANSRWVLYEVMPIDSHDAFTGLSPEQLTQLIPEGQIAPAAYQALIQSYARDLTQAEPNDPTERKWMTVRFTEPYSEVVDVDAQAGQPLPDSVFDPSGRSLVASLNQGANTEFAEGDEVTFDFETAQRLISEGKAEAVKPIYHRALNDYSRYFRGFQTDLESLQRQTSAAETDVGKLNDSIASLKDQIAFNERQASDLQFDVEGLNKEVRILREYQNALDAKWDQLRSELSRIYRTNRNLVRAMQAGG